MYTHSIINGENSLQKEAIFLIPYWIKTYDKIKNELQLNNCTPEQTKESMKTIVKKALDEKEENKRLQSNQSKTKWYNVGRCTNENNNNNEYLLHTSKFKTRCILLYKTKMLPIRCNTKWREKTRTSYVDGVQKNMEKQTTNQ